MLLEREGRNCRYKTFQEQIWWPFPVRDTAEQLLDVMFSKEKAKSFSQFSTSYG
jgi:hypothetical protein